MPVAPPASIQSTRILTPPFAPGRLPVVIKIVSGILGVAGLCWLALLFSSRAILVSERVEDATLHQQLVCTYFTGTRTMRKEYWYSKSDQFGRAACPRWQSLRDDE
jgi:hypothetical protein